MRLTTMLAKKFWWQRNLPRPVKVMHTLILSGISLSVATLMVTLGVAGGFKHDFQKALLQFHAHLTILPEGGVSLSAEELRKVLAKEGLEKEITAIEPYLYREVLMIHKGVIKGVVLKGIPMETHDSQLMTHDGLILGKALAEKLGEQNLKAVKVLIPKGQQITAKDTIRLQVAGTFHSGLYEIDEQFALIDLEQLQKLFGLSSKTKGFEIKFRDPAVAIPAGEKLKEAFPSLLIQNWAELNQPLLEAFALEKWFFWILIGFMVTVSGLNLVGAILLNIFRKKKVLAILQTLGMGRRSVRSLFAVEGVVLGLIGITIGLGLGSGVLFLLQSVPIITIDPEVYFLEKLPIHLAWTEGFQVALFSFLLVLGTSLWVSSRVAEIPIREGLHGPG